jgi:hypothetical protein
MTPIDENLIVLALLAVLAGAVAVLVGVLSSDTLRHEGLRGVVKRWFGR